MANKSNNSNQTITLPQGGGALHGIGETFSPDLHTGTGNFTVPIALPPGRNGFQPQLNLVYSTGNGNSPFGLGWGLSIPGVSRKTSRGIPRYADDRDTFLLSGAEDLVPVAERDGVIGYRPRTEGLFARIEHRRDAQTDHWEVRSKDGLISVVGMVDVLPVALLDSTRFSLDLTHTGSGQLRIKGQPDVPLGMPSESVFNLSDLPLADYDWTKTPKELWPVKILVNEPETAIFSGLSRQDAASAFPVASSGQRNAFEGRGVAGGWQIDMSARENQVVPDSLADLLITFTVSGYHDSGLRAAIDAAKPQTTALTSFLSARRIFPDAFYDFSRTGRMVWKVSREMLVLSGDLGRLRNIGFSLRPGAPDVHFGRLMTRLRVSFRVNQDAAGNVNGVTLFTIIPACTITQPAPMTVQVSATMDAPSELAWDFGDGSPILPGVPIGTPPKIQAAGPHAYTKPGRYVIKLRCVRGETLSEFRFSVVVSRTNQLGEPLFININRISVTPEKGLKFDAGGAVQQASRMLWRVGSVSAEGNSATFMLKPGHYTLDFAAVRRLKFRAYGAQRFVTALLPLPLQGLSATTNRTFDENGKETNGTGTPTPLPARNELAKRLFGTGEISPEDDWIFELIPEEILGVPAGTAIGAEELDLSDIQDVVLSMEYDITPGAP